MSAPSRNVSYVKPQEPSFLRAFKAKAGYKEPEVTIDTKRGQVSKKDDKDSEPDHFREDELPTVVYQSGNITEEEYRQFLEQQREEFKQDTTKIDSKVDSFSTVTKTTDDSTSSERGGKIMFKKPTKRTSTEAAATTGPLYSSSSKRKTKSEKEDKKKKKGSNAGVKNSTLLSFDDNDDDDEDR